MSIDVKQISKSYGRQKAVDGVSFSLGKGELAGFLGPNGAGKSTLMKIITGYLAADSGEIRINGELMTVGNAALKGQIGYLPENNPLYPDLYVSEFLEISAGFHNPVPSGSYIKEMIGRAGLGPEQHKKIGALSKGYRQRVGLAQALIHNPPVLILDEPTSGLDPNQLIEIRSMISEISKEKTVLLSSHILQEIEAICPRILIIHHGKLVADRNLQQLKEIRTNRFQQVFSEFNLPVTRSELMNIPGVRSAEPDNNGWLISAEGDFDIRPALFQFAVDKGVILLTLTERSSNLESIFQQLTLE